MNRTTIISTLVLILWLGILGNLSFKNQHEIIEQNKQLLINDSIMINHYLHRDSLYTDHIGRCSFISSDQIRFDRNNYVYIKPTKVFIP